MLYVLAARHRTSAAHRSDCSHCPLTPAVPQFAQQFLLQALRDELSYEQLLHDADNLVSMGFGAHNDIRQELLRLYAGLGSGRPLTASFVRLAKDLGWLAAGLNRPEFRKVLVSFGRRRHLSAGRLTGTPATATTTALAPRGLLAPCSHRERLIIGGPG